MKRIFLCSIVAAFFSFSLLANSELNKRESDLHDKLSKEINFSKNWQTATAFFLSTLDPEWQTQGINLKKVMRHVSAQGYTLLFEAFAKNDCPYEVIESLLKAGADPNFRLPKDITTPAREGPTNKPSLQGKVIFFKKSTIAHAACRRKFNQADKKIFVLIQQYNTDFFVKDEEEWTPWDVAVASNNSIAQEFIRGLSAPPIESGPQ